jgi:hypothetical protein
MNDSLVIEGQLDLTGMRARELCAVQVASGRVPRVSRLLALAIRFEELIQKGQVDDYSALAQLGHVSRGRITQIMNLLLLAPDIQEEILFLPLTQHCHEPIHLACLQPIALTWNWSKQRRRWHTLCRSVGQKRVNCLEVRAEPR